MLLINLAISFFSVLKANTLECMSMINQKCMSRPKIVDINNNEPVFYPYFIRLNKCSGNCNNINDPFAKLCVPDIINFINVKVFNLMSRINETRQIAWHETCKCVCRLTEAVCNPKQIRNKGKCQCECKDDLINKLVCDKGYIWNPSTCSCECNKLCNIAQYLDYKNCICRKSIVDKLVEECINVIDSDKMYNETMGMVLINDCPSRTPYIILFVVFLLTSAIISSAFIYYRYKNKELDLRKDFVNVDYSMIEKNNYWIYKR